jgi:outer membrane protein TolC
VYTEIRQTIWDGGLSKTSEQFEEALLISSLNQLEMELYKLNEQVSMSFYTASLTEAQLDVIKAQKKTALENRKAIESGIKNGVMEKSAILALDAELLGIEQIEHQFVSIQRTAFNTLSILTGKNIENGMKLEITDRILKSSDGAQRHEYQFFASQNAQLGVQGELLKRSRYPKIFGFGQAGYGKPGLNMLNDKFDAFYLVGIGVSWNAFDWKKTYRQQQILELQSKDIGFRKDSFTQTLKILLDQQVQQIKKMDELIVKDYQIIHLRNEITKAAESKSRNGVLTTSEFIRELQNETVAKLNLELHKIQLLEAKEKYNILIGGIKF